MPYFYNIINYLIKNMNFPILLVLLSGVVVVVYLLILQVFKLGYREGEDEREEKVFNLQNKLEAKGETDMLKWGKDIKSRNKPMAGATLIGKDPSVQITSNGIRKVIINRRGGVPLMLSDFGFEVLKARGCINDKICAPCLVKRDDPRFVSAFEEYGEELTGGMSRLKILEIPADMKWELVERDGVESIEEIHRTWY